MFTRRRSQYHWDPQVREELLGRLRQWLDEAQDDDEIALTRRDVETAESALVNAVRDIPMLERRLEYLVQQDARAKQALKDGKGKERLYEACRIKGWIAPSGSKTTKYPPFDSLLIEHQYVALTTRSGQVTIGDEVAEFPHAGELLTDVVEERLITIDDCPLDPWGAVEQLAAIYGAASPKAMRKELWQRFNKLEALREELQDAGDMLAAEALPDLSTLPHQRDDL